MDSSDILFNQNFFYSLINSSTSLDYDAWTHWGNNIIKSYIKDDFSNVSEIVNEFSKHSNSSILTAFGNLNTNKQQNANQHWAVFVCARLNNEIIIFINSDLNGQYNFKNFLIGLFEEPPAKVLENTLGREASFDSCLFASMKWTYILLQQMKNKATDFNVSNYQDEHEFNAFQKHCVNEMLKINFNTKNSLQKVIQSLNYLLGIDQNHILSEEEFAKIINLLKRKLTFKPRNNDKIDLLWELINICYQLKLRGQVITKEATSILTEYFNDNKEKYVNDIDNYIELLNQDHQNNCNKECLILAIDNRINFFKLLFELLPFFLKISDLESFLFKYYYKPEGCEALLEEKESLQNELVTLTKEIHMQRINQNVDMKILELSHQTDAKITDINQKLHLILKRSEVNKKAKFIDIVVIIKDKVYTSTDEAVSLKCLDIILEVVKECHPTDICVAILEIFLSLPENIKLSNNVPDIFSCITQENANLVIQLARRNVLPQNNLDNLGKYLIGVLQENDDSNIRNSALEALENMTLSPDVADIVGLENECVNNEKKVPKKCLEFVKRNKKLTVRAFETLAHFLNSKETRQVIQLIIENDIQKIHKTFIDGYLHSLVYIEMNKEIIEIMRALVIGKYIALGQIPHFCDMISNKKFTDDILDIILVAVKQGEKIHESIVKQIQTLPKSRKTECLIKMIRNITSDLDILRNSRKDISDRRLALRNIIKDTSCHSPSTVEELFNIMLYEDEIKLDLFYAILSILPNKHSKHNYEIDMNWLVKFFLDKNIPIADVKTLFDKDKSVGNELVDFLLLKMFTNSEEQVTSAKILSEIVTYKNNLVSKCDLEAVYLVCNDEAKEVIFEILQKHFCDETLICKNVIDIDIDYILKEVKEIIESNNFISRGKINFILDSLENLSLQKYHERLLDVILAIENAQTLPADIYRKVLNIININDELWQYPSTFSFLILCCKKSIHIPEEVVSTIWINFSKQIINLEQLVKVAAFLSVDHVIPMPVLTKIDEMLKCNGVDLNMKLLSIYILSTQKSLPETILFTLKLLSLNTKTFDKYIALNKAAFEAFMQLSGSITISIDYLKSYSQILIKQIDLNEENSLQFVTYVERIRSQDDLLLLLGTLSNLILVGETSSVSRIIENFEDEKWLQELLSHELLFRSLKDANNHISITEVHLSNYFENLRNLELFIENLKDGSFSIQKTLQKLIEKQMVHELNFKHINNLLILLSSDVQCNHLLFSDSKNFLADIMAMEKLWLGNLLKTCDIQFTESDLIMLKKFLPYDIPVINVIFDKIESNVKISDLISFFKLLSNEYLSTATQENFLENLIQNELFNWKHSLLKFIVENIFLSRHYLDENEKVTTSLKGKLVKMLLLGWKLDSIVKVIECCNNKHVLSILNESLDPIYEYKLREFDQDILGNDLLTIIDTTPSNKLQMTIHNLALCHIFPGTYKKQFSQLEQEIYNVNMTVDTSLINDTQLLDKYDQIVAAYAETSAIVCNKKKISEWKQKDVKNWAELVRKERTSISPEEMVAVVKRAVEIIRKYPPRDVQILSLICTLNTEHSKGRLLQINTGEGKTTIIAMFAVIKVLEGHKVDIITSSPELAKPQSLEQKDFYSIFGITVSHNGDDIVDIKQRYKCDVVYGAAGNFQGDILRDEYSKLGTMNGRKCDIGIVDEVDSMLIDGKNHIVMLSSTMPAMNHLEVILAAIWLQVDSVSNCLKEENGELYYLGSERSFDENTGKIKILETLHSINTSKEEFIEKSTEIYIRKMLRDTENLAEEDKNIGDDYPKITVPEHLWEFVTKVQLKEWINRAICAKFQSEKGKHYIIKNGKIAPVDAVNTGVVQQNMHWNSGLHQFLQIKHGLKITPESLTTNFISNVTYFRRYKENIFGLTGTLGSQKSRELLENTYNVDSLIIPPFKQKQHVEIEPIVALSKTDWLHAILESSMNKLKNNRAVLIITKYIEEVKSLVNMLNEDFKYDRSKIKVYKTELDSKVVNEELQVGEIIIATNIAGRGTDIKLSSQVEANGGLHVLITFLPLNERVENQNVGRTSRTGNRGTSQFIVYSESKTDFGALKNLRNLQEEISLNSASTEINTVTLKDKIFEKFCYLLNEVSDKQFINKHVKLRAVEERFGIWLQIHKDVINKGEQRLIFEKFEEFRKSILNECSPDRLIKNATFYVLSGNQFLDNSKYISAIKEFSSAINVDKKFSEHAYYNRGYARLAQYAGNTNKNKFEIEAAIEDFKMARKQLEERELELHLIQKTSSGEHLSDQVAHKMTLLSMQRNIIDHAIGIDVDVAKKQIEALEAQKKVEGKSKEDIKNIDDQIKALKDVIQLRGNGGVIGQALKTGRDMKVEFSGISKSLPESEDIDLYKDEIDEFKGNGFIGAFNVSEIKPIEWKSVIGVALLGLGQLILGGAVAVFSLGAGSSIGLGFIMEGVSDLITAVKNGIIKRDFSWASWGIQKAISVAVSIVCAGMSAVKDAAKTVGAVAKNVTTAINQTVKQGWKLAAKTIGTNLAKGVARDIVTELIDYGVDKLVLPAIEEKIVDLVQEPIQNALLSNEKVKAMLELDILNKNKNYEKLIKTSAEKLFEKEKKQGGALETIIKGIATGIANNKVKGISSGALVQDALSKLLKIRSVIDHFNKKFQENIDQIYEKNKIEDQLLQHATKKRQILDDDDEFDDKKAEEPKLERNYCTLGNFVATKVSSYVGSYIKGSIISPLSNVCVSYGMNAVFSDLDKRIHNEICDYQAQRRIEFFQDPNKHYRIPSEFKKDAEDAAALRNADSIIENLREGGEAGLPHLGPLSDAVDRPLRILDEKGRVIRTIGQDKGGQPIDVQYNVNPDNTGHWTLPGGIEPNIQNGNRNDCLFNVVAQQAGIDPVNLRNHTVENMVSNRSNVANQVKDIMRLESVKREALQLGGAKYYGDADKALSESQGVKGHGYTNPAHPRGHANDPNAPDIPKSLQHLPKGKVNVQEQIEIKNIQNYSNTNPPHSKTGFKSIKDQNDISHLALSHPKGQAAINKLNQGSKREVLKLHLQNDLGLSGYQLERWQGGNFVCNEPMTKITMVLQHQDGKFNDVNAPVHIQTCYPEP